MSDIIIETQNPHDVEEEDLRSLAEVLSPSFPQYRLGYAYYPSRERLYGVTWWEVIRIWLPEIEHTILDGVVSALIALAIDWARKRFKKGGTKSLKRPKYVAIYGPNGQVISSVLVKDEKSDVDILTESDLREDPKSMPPIQGYFDDSHNQSAK